MKLKPKSTVQNKRALLYRRYTDIEQSMAISNDTSNPNIYQTIDDKKWIFDTETQAFIEYEGTSTNVKTLFTGEYLRYKYTQSAYKYYTYANNEWSSTTTAPASFDNMKYPNTQKYQLNKYYYVGSFDYMMKGGVDTEDIQYIKGNIIPTQTFDIKWFNDDMKIDHDDLVVVNDRLYMVQSVSYDIKRMPKPYKVYFGTLSNIL